MMTGSSSANATATPHVRYFSYRGERDGNRTTSSGGFTMAKDGSIVYSKMIH